MVNSGMIVSRQMAFSGVYVSWMICEIEIENMMYLLVEVCEFSSCAGGTQS